MKIYSLEEAQNASGEIKKIARDISIRGREYLKVLSEVTQLIINFRDNPYDKEGVLDRTIKLRKELRELFEVMQKFNVFLREMNRGTVDFPSEMDGEEIFLCWRSFEEPKIMFWHKRNEPCSMRKPLKENSES